MGKIYIAPKEFKKPDYAQYPDFDKYMTSCEKYIAAADVRKEVKNLEGLNKLFGTRKRK
jgi:hypothetical protein